MYIYIYTYRHIYRSIYIYIYVFEFIFSFIDIYIYTYMQAAAMHQAPQRMTSIVYDEHPSVHIVCICTYIYTCTYTYFFIYTHTHTHTYIHMCILAGRGCAPSTPTNDLHNIWWAHLSTSCPTSALPRRQICVGGWRRVMRTSWFGLYGGHTLHLPQIGRASCRERV